MSFNSARSWLGAVAVALVACNKPIAIVADATAAGDAIVVDATADAAPDAFVGPISITVWSYGDPTVPLVNAEVQFVTGSVTQTVMTDASGIATANAPAGTTVIVYETAELGVPLVKSFADARPGDMINAGGWPQQGFPILGNIGLSVPTMAGSGDYVTRISCQIIANSTAVRAEVVGCPTQHDATAVAWVQDADGNLLSGASTLQHLDLPTLVGTTITMPAYDLAPASITGEFTNVPATATDSGWNELYDVGADTTTFASASSSPPAAAMPILGVGDRTVSTFYFTPAGFDSVRFGQVDAARITDFEVDASTAIAAITDTHYDLATNSIVWTESTVGTPATIVNAIVVVTTSNGAQKLELQLHAPHPASTSIALPPMPSGLAPVGGDRVDVMPSFQSTTGLSYDASMQIVDTNPGFEPIGWSPTFVGSLWEAG